MYVYMCVCVYKCVCVCVCVCVLLSYQSKYYLALSAGAAEYTDCISA